MDTSFTELRRKEVINIADGRRLGRVVDLVFGTQQGKICGIVVPGDSSFRLFGKSEDIYIPWNNILRIGGDVVLVDLDVCARGHGRAHEVSAELPGKVSYEQPGDDYIRNKADEHYNRN